jgi:hypothetical protein
MMKRRCLLVAVGAINVVFSLFGCSSTRNPTFALGVQSSSMQAPRALLNEQTKQLVEQARGENELREIRAHLEENAISSVGGYLELGLSSPLLDAKRGKWAFFGWLFHGGYTEIAPNTMERNADNILRNDLVSVRHYGLQGKMCLGNWLGLCLKPYGIQVTDFATADDIVHQEFSYGFFVPPMFFYGELFSISLQIQTLTSHFIEIGVNTAGYGKDSIGYNPSTASVFLSYQYGPTK